MNRIYGRLNQLDGVLSHTCYTDKKTELLSMPDLARWDKHCIFTVTEQCYCSQRVQ